MRSVFKKKPSGCIFPSALILVLGLCGCPNDKIHRVTIPINKSGRDRKAGMGFNQGVRSLPELVEILKKLETNSKDISEIVTTDYEIRSVGSDELLPWETQRNYLVQLLNKQDAMDNQPDGINEVRLNYIADTMPNILSQFGELFKVTDSTELTLSFTKLGDGGEESIKTFKPSSQSPKVPKGFSLDLLGSTSNEVRVYRYNKIGAQKQIQVTVWKNYNLPICNVDKSLRIGITQTLNFGGTSDSSPLIRVSSRLVDFLKNDVAEANARLSNFKEDFWIKPETRKRVNPKGAPGATAADITKSESADKSYDFSVRGYRIPSNFLESIYNNVKQKKFINSDCSS